MSEFENLFCEAIENLSVVINKKLESKELLGIGFVTSDDLSGIAAYYRFEDDLPKNHDLYDKYSPVEWKRSEGDCFHKLNEELKSICKLRLSSDYETLVREIYDGCINSINKLKLRKKYGEYLYLTFTSTDPSEFMLEEEQRFVKRMNTSKLYSEWKLVLD